MLSEPLSFTVSAKLSIGLTLFAVAIAIAIYRDQHAESKAAEIRIRSDIREANEYLDEAYKTKTIPKPSSGIRRDFGIAAAHYQPVDLLGRQTILWVDDDQMRQLLTELKPDRKSFDIKRR